MHPPGPVDGEALWVKYREEREMRLRPDGNDHSEGYRATIVNGRVAVEMGRHTGDLAGVMLRTGRGADRTLTRK